MSKFSKQNKQKKLKIEKNNKGNIKYRLFYLKRENILIFFLFITRFQNLKK